MSRHDELYPSGYCQSCGQKESFGLCTNKECNLGPIKRNLCRKGHIWLNDFGEDWTPNSGDRCACGKHPWK